MKRMITKLIRNLLITYKIFLCINNPINTIILSNNSSNLCRISRWIRLILAELQGKFQLIKIIIIIIVILIAFK